MRTTIVTWADGTTRTVLDVDGDAPSWVLEDMSEDIAREHGTTVVSYITTEVPDDQAEASRVAAAKAIAQTARPTGSS